MTPPTPIGPLPADSVLVHIGMHKTGTTALQSILAGARAYLAERGIIYPGPGNAHHHLAFSLLGPTARLGRATVPEGQDWQTLTSAAAANPGRTVLSSEFFSRAEPEAIQNFVDAIGRDRVHIVMGVRYLGAVGLSAWQQSLKTGDARSLEEWFDTEFVPDGAGRLTGFYWNEQHPVTAVRRWVDALGPDRVTTMVVDGVDRSALPRLFESLLDLESGTLCDRQPQMINRSMTAAETAFTREVNRMLKGRLSSEKYEELIRYGMLRRMVEGRPQTPQEAKLVVPEGARALAAHEGTLCAQEIAATGVRVVGDLARLSGPTDFGPAVGSNAELPNAAAVEAVVGTVSAAAYGNWNLREPNKRRRPRQPTSPAPVTKRATNRAASVDSIPTEELILLLLRRLWAAARRRISRLRHRAP